MSSSSVSVVIPTYNRAHLIARSIRSVLAAIEPGDEVIVVDDGSTDGTAEVLRPFGDQIRLVRGQHRGCGAARNVGIAAARNPLITFNDSDDEWTADKLTLQRALLAARPDLVFCCADFGLREEGGVETSGGLVGWHQDTRPWDQILGRGQPYSSLAPLPPGRPDFPVHIGDLYPTMLRGNYVASQATLVRRDLAGAALAFSEDVAIHEDWECWSRVARLGPVAYMDCVTFWQWGHAGPRVSGANELRWATDRLKVMQRVWGRDEQFLAQFGERYQRALIDERVARVRALVRVGQSREARAELRLAGGGPLRYRLAASLPGAVLWLTFAARQMLKALVAAVFINRDFLNEGVDAVLG
jgi:glycosyltransferase involved in cell wall biosynthesis